jgi:hypothetical protein
MRLSIRPRYTEQGGDPHGGASGIGNLLDDDSAIGVMQMFEGWNHVLGQGYRPPWRRPAP